MKNVKAGHARPVVFLDAGHFGKYNQSPVVPEYYESDMNWKLHLLLKENLERYGIDVRLTRQDQERDLNEYYRGTASEGADLLLSVHSNAAQRESADHPVVYVPLNGSGNELGKALAVCIRNLMETTEEERIAVREGANGDYYGVIRGATAVGTIGLILEHSFHTNERATRWLLEDSNLEALAEAEALEVAQWFDVSDQPEKTETSRYSLALPLLQKGDSSPAVKAAQLLLAGWGYPCGSYGADGIFGEATQKAVIEYQTAKELLVDGIIGEETMSSLLGG